MRTGGDNNSAGQSRRKNRSNRSRRPSQKVKDRMERNHILMMANIRKARNPSSTNADPEEQVGEACVTRLTHKNDADKLGEDDDSSSLDDSDDLLIDRAAALLGDV